MPHRCRLRNDRFNLRDLRFALVWQRLKNIDLRRTLEAVWHHDSRRGQEGVVSSCDQLRCKSNGRVRIRNLFLMEGGIRGFWESDRYEISGTLRYLPVNFKIKLPLILVVNELT